MRANVRVVAAAAVFSSATFAAQAQQAVQWKVSDGGNGHWYKLVQSTVTWNVARLAAESMGGHLATPTTSAENAFVTTVKGNQGAWIGGVRDLGSGPCVTGWKWITDEPWVYTNWWTGEPNGTANCEDAKIQWCLMMGWPSQPASRWNDEASDPAIAAIPAYVIEWSADCNGDGIVDYGQCRDGSLPDYDGNNIPDCCETGTPCVVGNYPVQWRVEDGGNGHWYNAFVQDGITWSDARSLAIGMGGDLAALSTSVECDYVFARVISRPALWNNRIGPWIGLRQLPGSIEPDGGWTWVDGTPLTEARWLTGHPTNHPPGAPPRDYAIYSAWPTAPANTWADDSNAYYYPYHWESHRSYAVEWSTDCNNDGIVDYGQILSGHLADTNGDGIPNTCQCPGDVTGNNAVDGVDLAIVLSAWGTNGNGEFQTDIDGDGLVGGTDLAYVLGGWGPCQ